VNYKYGGLMMVHGSTKTIDIDVMMIQLQLKSLLIIMRLTQVLGWSLNIMVGLLHLWHLILLSKQMNSYVMQDSLHLPPLRLISS